jgi:hypothetical protein
VRTTADVNVTVWRAGDPALFVHGKLFARPRAFWESG